MSVPLSRIRGTVWPAWTSCAAALVLAGHPALAAQPAEHLMRDLHRDAPEIRAARLSGSIHLDGRLDEPAWNAATPVTRFTQRDPHEGEPASENTEVRALIDDDALYVGARLFDRHPEAIRQRLSRRDDPVESDAFDVYVDAHHDHLTARHFRVTPAGAILDATVSVDGNEDNSWDPVWAAATRVDSLGWTTEMRIPLSQLRYDPHGDTWGIQFVRRDFRTAETDWFAFTPKKEHYGPERYGHLTGLGDLPTTAHLELRPYGLARNERLLVGADNPLRSGNDYFGSAGLDLKYGVTSSLTLDATVNPDFGQVEVDPAEVNLTTVETFYPEKRSFFVEGADIFAFDQSRAYNNFGSLRVFHSRRIGRAPQHPLFGPYLYTDAPGQTTILGAAKLTGKTPGGWEIGALDALTAREEGQFVDAGGQQGETPVEPLTHYFANRVRKEFRGGQTVVGSILTAVNRDVSDPALASQLRSNAYVAGLDLNHAWGRRTWGFDAAVSQSLLYGSAAALAAAQRSPLRYYQRPDHTSYAVYDPTRTSLGGYAVDASISKLSGNHWLESLAYSSKSPGYELNDLGFQTRADYRAVSSIVLYNENRPGRLFRNYSFYPYMNQVWNFGGDLVYNAYAGAVEAQLANYWYASVRGTRSLAVIDDRLTRGGPQAKPPAGGNWNVSLTSDSRRPWSVSPNYTFAWNDKGGRGWIPGLVASFRASPTLRLSIEPQFSSTHALAQYVTAVADSAAVSTYGKRYVFATLDQKQLSLVTRADWTLNPRLSFQVYVQPLAVSGDFSHFKEFTTPRGFDFDVYGQDRGTITRDDPGGTYTVDPGSGSAFQFPDPNFNFRSLLGNAVIRWEFRPGSTLYFVWQQRRTGVAPIGDFNLDRDLGAIFDARPENVFAIKATYWIGV